MSILIYFATIFWSLFPNLIHVFQGGENQVIKVDETNLVDNGDLSLDSDSNDIPDGFTYSLATDITLMNGVAKFTATARNGKLAINNVSNFNSTDIFYNFASVKSLRINVGIANSNGTIKTHSGSGNFEFLSSVGIFSNIYTIAQVYDYNNDGFTPISVEYIGVYNVSTMINNGFKNDDGVLFSNLTNEEIRLQLDKWISYSGGSSLSFKIDNTNDKWFNTGFVEKQAERDFLDYLGYFVWLMTPPVILFISLDLIRRLL